MSLPGSVLGSAGALAEACGSGLVASLAGIFKLSRVAGSSVYWDRSALA